MLMQTICMSSRTLAFATISVTSRIVASFRTIRQRQCPSAAVTLAPSARPTSQTGETGNCRPTGRLHEACTRQQRTRNELRPDSTLAIGHQDHDSLVARLPECPNHAKGSVATRVAAASPGPMDVATGAIKDGRLHVQKAQWCAPQVRRRGNLASAALSGHANRRAFARAAACDGEAGKPRLRSRCGMMFLNLHNVRGSARTDRRSSFYRSIDAKSSLLEPR